MLSGLVGNFVKFESKEEGKKFGLLALIFGLIIGVYWTLRPMKDGIFNAIVGGEFLWKAKILSIVVVVPLVIVYSWLIDSFRREKVFYILLGLYLLATVGFMFAFADSSIGLANKVADQSRYIGWAWYVFVESFGSIIVALFWVLVTDMTLPDAARRGFPLVALCGQIGNMTFPYVLNAQRLGLASSVPVVGACAALMGVTGLMMRYFMATTPKELLVGYHEGEKTKEEKGKEGGFLEGLKILVTNGYLMGIFAIISIYEIIVTVIDYHFKQTAFAQYGDEVAVNGFLAKYAVLVGIVATMSVLLGINKIQKYLGMTASLLLLPILVYAAVLVIKFNPTSLNISLWVMVLAKAVNYALNQPTMKQLYIPTSKDARQKAQGWIEMFGSRSSKGAASFFINPYRSKMGVALFLSSVATASLGLVLAWLAIAVYVAKKYNTAVENDEIVC